MQKKYTVNCKRPRLNSEILEESAHEEEIAREILETNFMKSQQIRRKNSESAVDWSNQGTRLRQLFPVSELVLYYIER